MFCLQLFSLSHSGGDSKPITAMAVEVMDGASYTSLAKLSTETSSQALPTWLNPSALKKPATSALKNPSAWKKQRKKPLVKLQKRQNAIKGAKIFFKTGERVVAQFRGNKGWDHDRHLGKISKVNSDGTYAVLYDDGDIHKKLESQYIKPSTEPSHARAPSPKKKAKLSGSISRPRGQPPKGMKWDGEQGQWVSEGGSSSANVSSSAAARQHQGGAGCIMQLLEQTHFTKGARVLANFGGEGGNQVNHFASFLRVSCNFYWSVHRHDHQKKSRWHLRCAVCMYGVTPNGVKLISLVFILVF
jgi:hypothetical protein